MDGITILNTIPQVDTNWGWDIWGIILLIASVILFILTISMVENNSPDVMLAVLPMLVFLFSGLVILSHARITTTYDIYEVIINDTVNFNEFQKRYEIIEQRGKIYTIKER